MNKQEIISKLQQNHKAFTSLIMSLNEHDFLFTVNDKWSSGQQTEHIYRSIKPVKLAFTLPKFLLKMKFGKSNRPSRSYEDLFLKYKHKLAAGGRASARFIPAAVELDQKEKLCNAILNTNNKLCKRVNAYKETALDIYILPHPLLGKLTLREMLYFNILHVEHHRQTVMELLKKN